MPGAQAHPQPCVRNEKAHKSSHHGRAGITRHSRTRMVLTVSFVLFPETGLVVSVTSEIIISQA